ncbi:MAG TPA: bifunctional shikimate kinase/3-dehydroquinate synthase [Gaiellaceae bacterium]|nr:bifunctional shikimate kinase/3-dehydroquinate synthase [Gaiellaceae bacterium]
MGFMGAGKSTLGREVARRLGRPFVDLDAEIERHASASISTIFATRGEVEFRAIEQKLACEALDSAAPTVISLGGGAMVSQQTARKLRERALTVLVDVDVDEAWRRARRSERRPLAQNEIAFRELYEQRKPLYEEAADGRAEDADGILLAAARLLVEPGCYQRLAELVPEHTEAVVDERVLGMHPLPLECPVRIVPDKTLATCDNLWHALRLERGGTLVAVGGGTTTDVAGYVAATYLRGISWIAVPTTLVGQVDAAIGGKTGIDLPEGKNLVGAFHWPACTVVDPELLATLPEVERRNGLAEVVKTGLLAGEPLWELPEAELVRRCAAFKAAVCLRDPREEGERAMLNLGHTFGHALEAASGYALPHGEAVALGLIAALRLSGLDEQAAEVDELLQPTRPRVDADAAWAALERDKKARGGRVRLVLLDAPGKPRTGVELPEEDVRTALRDLIA